MGFKNKNPPKKIFIKFHKSRYFNSPKRSDAFRPSEPFFRKLLQKNIIYAYSIHVNIFQFYPRFLKKYDNYLII